MAYLKLQIFITFYISLVEEHKIRAKSKQIESEEVIYNVIVTRLTINYYQLIYHNPVE